MAWSPKAADSREAGYIYANRSVSAAILRLQKRSGPYISRGDVLQHQLVQAQFGDQSLQLRVLLLQFLQAPRLVYLQTAVFLTPPEVGLLRNTGFLRCLRCRLAVCHGHFNLPQQIHYLLRLILLASSHRLSLSSVSRLHWNISSRALQHHLETCYHDCSHDSSHSSHILRYKCTNCHREVSPMTAAS
jgi:hypothetical protein